jgi:response regulator NasT
MSDNSASKRRVLLVDDDPITLATIAKILRNAGYETAQAESGEEALSIAVEFYPDLALLDVMMEGMSGIELGKRLQEKADIPFMFISAHAETEIIKQATDNGAVGYLLKPFDIAQVIPAFEAALGRADDIKRLRSSEASLTTALNAGRETAMAVGLLVAKFGADRNTAFEVLRDYARSNRHKINDVATSLLDAEELSNSFKRLFERRLGI